MSKTIFITITRGFLVRNILRSGVLERLKQSGCKIVIFLQIAKGRDVPEYLREEFEDAQVVIEKIYPSAANTLSERCYLFFVRWTSLLVYSDSTWAYSKAGNLNSRSRMWFWKHIERLIFSLVGRMHFLKGLVRFAEKKYFLSAPYAAYFDRYRPDLVFSSSITAGIDVAFLKEASRRGIKTVSMTKGWDHATRVLYRFIPDRVIIQNDVMKDYLIHYQRIGAEKIRVCGFPQFDWYQKKDLLISREEYFRSLGLDPNRKMIFFGSEGAWSPHDDHIIATLAQFIETPGMLTAPSCMLIRPHFSDSKAERFQQFRGREHIAVDEHIRYSDALPCNWDPGMDEARHFVNLLYHCDISVNIASTLTLDACCFDKPIIAVGFGALRHLRSGRDVTGVYYEMDHYQDVLKTGAVDLVHSEQELLGSVNRCLLHPEHRRAERKILLDKLCYKVDGNSSKRIADEILSLL